MSAFNDWRLSKKVAVCFLAIAALFVTMSVTTIMSNKTLSAVATRHVERGIAGAEALSRIISALREHRIIIFSQMNATNGEEARGYEERFRKNRETLKQAIDDYAKIAGEFMPNVEKLRGDVDTLEAINDKIMAIKNNGDAVAALSLVKGEGKSLSRTAISDVEELMSLQTGRSAKANEAGIASANNVFWITLLLSMGSLAALFVVWRMLTKTVAQPLMAISSVTKKLADGGEADVPHRNRKDELGDVANAVELFRQAAVQRTDTDMRLAAEQKVITTALRDSLEAMTNGDLTAEIAVDFPPAYTELKANFNAALTSLRGLIAQVSESAARIRTGSAEISHASDDLARRTEGSAASLEQTSAALAQIDGRLKASAIASAKTVQRADGAISTVSGGRSVADEAVAAMGRVAESARGIDSVIEGLDKIAFQTRVLAMNAAVEAGRAGEAGRGFAVVADLVSALAMRAEEEAKRARDQLTVTQDEVGSAVESVRKVDTALAAISGDVAEVHQLLGTMAADNQAQSSAISEIAVAIGTMDQSTQQNAAMVEETSAAARNLMSEVQSLSDQAGRFAIDQGLAATPAQSRTPSFSAKLKPANFAQPTRQLPAAAVPALTRPVAADDGDWNEF